MYEPGKYEACDEIYNAIKDGRLARYIFRECQKSRDFESMVQSMTIDLVTKKSKLNKHKFNFDK